MNAKELFDAINSNYDESYFGSYEELDDILNNASFPCLVVIPISKQVQFIADRFKTIETVVIASLDEMELDTSTSDVYDSISKMEGELLEYLYPFTNQILSYQSISELNKFNSNLTFAAFSIELINDPKCFEQ